MPPLLRATAAVAEEAGVDTVSAVGWACPELAGVAGGLLTGAIVGLAGAPACGAAPVQAARNRVPGPRPRSCCARRRLSIRARVGVPCGVFIGPGSPSHSPEYSPDHIC